MSDTHSLGGRPADAPPLPPPFDKAPFEATRRTSRYGYDVWRLREVYPYMGIETWDEVRELVHDAALCAQAQALPADTYTERVHEDGGVDFEVTSLGMYLCALLCDISAPAVWGAQAYFAAHLDIEDRAQWSRSPVRVPLLDMTEARINDGALLAEEFLAQFNLSEEDIARFTPEFERKAMEQVCAARGTYAAMARQPISEGGAVRMVFFESDTEHLRSALYRTVYAGHPEVFPDGDPFGD